MHRFYLNIAGSLLLAVSIAAVGCGGSSSGAGNSQTAANSATNSSSVASPPSSSSTPAPAGNSSGASGSTTWPLLRAGTQPQRRVPRVPGAERPLHPALQLPEAAQTHPGARRAHRPPPPGPPRAPGRHQQRAPAPAPSSSTGTSTSSGIPSDATVYSQHRRHERLEHLHLCL